MWTLRPLDTSGIEILKLTLVFSLFATFITLFEKWLLIAEKITKYFDSFSHIAKFDKETNFLIALS